MARFNGLKIFSVIVLLTVVLTLSVVLGLVWTMPDLSTSHVDKQIYLPDEAGTLKCGTTQDLLGEYLERKIAVKYEEVKSSDEKRQQDFLNKNKVRLMSKKFWEMKPAAKLIGKEQPATQKILGLVWTMPDLPTSHVNNQIYLPDEAGTLKCGTTQDLLGEYLERKIAVKYEEVKSSDEKRQQSFLNKNKVRLMSIYDKNFWERKPAAKLTGKEQPAIQTSDPEIGMVPIREWRNGRELYDTSGFERYGIRYRNGRLVVPVDGTYFIYSFLDLFEQCDPATGKPNVKDASKPIKHGIYKFNILEEEEQELVSNIQPHTYSHNKYYNSYSSYVSSLADLKAGDELSVKVSNFTLMRYTRENYFGVNLI